MVHVYTHDYGVTMMCNVGCGSHMIHASVGIAVCFTDYGVAMMCKVGWISLVLVPCQIPSTLCTGIPMSSVVTSPPFLEKIRL